MIGGGPAGLMAAGKAAAAGASVLLLERMDRVGLKLGLTGKGRCNLTNVAPVPEMLQHFGAGGNFLRAALCNFGNRRLIGFFADLGVATAVERGGRVFPEAGSAVELARALKKWAAGTGVEILTSRRVDRLLVDEGRIRGVWVGDDFYRARAAVIATGGLSYPRTGSSGDGYRLAASVGHTVVAPRPALVPLDTPTGHWSRTLPGLALKNVRCRLTAGGRRIADEFGEMIFTHTGVSGPIVLSLSLRAGDALAAGAEVALSLDFKPALDEKKLDLRLLRDLKEAGKRRIAGVVKGLLPRALVPVCLAASGIDPLKRADQVTREERLRLRLWLKGADIPVLELRPAAEAVVTAGGVSRPEINPRSMESRLVRGLFFAGEVIDIDADTGGYNLQAAFSTGYLAGAGAAAACL